VVALAQVLQEASQALHLLASAASLKNLAAQDVHPYLSVEHVVQLADPSVHKIALHSFSTLTKSVLQALHED